MKKITTVTLFAVVLALQAWSLYGADRKLGNIFIKATSTTVDGKQFQDQEMEDSVKDLKKNADKFDVVESEKEADYLLVVVERSRLAKYIEVRATLSFKENGEWKPGARLTGAANRVWSLAAERLMKDAVKWVEARRK